MRGPVSELKRWLTHIDRELAKFKSANSEFPADPYSVNQIVHESNGRLEVDMALDGTRCG